MLSHGAQRSRYGVDNSTKSGNQFQPWSFGGRFFLEGVQGASAVHSTLADIGLGRDTNSETESEVVQNSLSRRITLVLSTVRRTIVLEGEGSERPSSHHVGRLDKWQPGSTRGLVNK